MQYCYLCRSILDVFEIDSGLKVNFHINKLGGVGISCENLLRYASILNCKTMSTPFEYLGLVVGGNPRSEDFGRGSLER